MSICQKQRQFTPCTKMNSKWTIYVSVKLYNFEYKTKGETLWPVVSEVLLDISNAWPKQDRFNKIKNFSLQDTAKSVIKNFWNERKYMQTQSYKNDNQKSD